MSEKEPAVSGKGGQVRVLYCEGNVDGTVGGSHYCLLYLIQHLDRSRFTPLVLFYDNHAIVPKFRAIAETLVHDKDAPVQWGSTIGGWVSLPLSVARRAVNSAKLALKIAGNVAFLRRRRIQLLHLNNSITRLHDWIIAARIVGIPCIVHERGLPRYREADRKLGRRLSLIIPVSRWIGRAMVEQGVDPDNIRVMYDGLDPDNFSASHADSPLRAAWDVQPGQPVVGIVGNVRHWKGQETVVRALIEVVSVHPQVVCFFVGAATPEDAPYMAQLKALIAQAGIERNVRFTGYQQNVAAFLAMMRFVIHASVQPEPFGMVVLEAMALRKAVIGSRAGGVIEMVVDGETGYTFTPGDASALAQRMIELLDDPAKSERMGASGYRRLVEHFSVQQYMTRIHAAYQAVLEGRNVAPAVPLEGGEPG